jgi:hypothetical protein
LFIAASGGVVGPVKFKGKVTALLGAGNDFLALGTAGAGADGNVVFESAGNKIDGGAGMDLFDSQLGQFESEVNTPSFVDPTP